jgi:hypothetical protein
MQADAAQKAIKWRQNKAFLRRKCPDCLQSFTRAHLNHCKILPDNIQALHEDSRFIMDVSDIASELEEKGSKNLPHFNYTLMDYLLNEKRYQDFLDAFDLLDTILLR